MFHDFKQLAVDANRLGPRILHDQQPTKVGARLCSDIFHPASASLRFEKAFTVIHL
jgi:hypothetical protein